jgi:DNA-directed RNA polymerase subunit RPC12/RpoP
MEYRGVKPDDDDSIRCPECGGTDVRRSLSKRFFDHIPGIFSYSAMRCRSCRHRFYCRFDEEIEEEEGGPEVR